MKTIAFNFRILCFSVFPRCLLMSLIAGCSSLQIAPTQLGRIVQMETFKQTFDFSRDLVGDCATVKPEDFLQTENRVANIEKVFSTMLGKKNWYTLKDRYGSKDIYEELNQKQIMVKGAAQFHITPDPEDASRFLLEGTGKYLLIREKTHAILLAGDFISPLASYSLADIEAGFLPLDITLYISNIPGETAYLEDGVTVRYVIKIDTRRKKQGVYRIDYEKAHDVLLLNCKTGENNDGSCKIGQLRFDNSGNANLAAKKLWDLKGLDFLRSNYR